MNTGFWGWLAGYKKKGNCSRKRGGDPEDRKHQGEKRVTAGKNFFGENKRETRGVIGGCRVEKEKNRSQGGKVFRLNKTEGAYGWGLSKN